MSEPFQPDLSVLQPPQRVLWDEMVDVPESFVLCGGTAIALHLGHRTSVDFDFFGSSGFDPDTLYDRVAMLGGSRVTQKAPRTLTCLVDRGGPVPISFFCVPKIQLIHKPLVTSDNKIRVASLLDLAGMKAAVVQKRAEAKDYLDMDAILGDGRIDLPTALSAGATIYGASFNPELTLKSLSYYGDGNLDTLAPGVRERLATAVRAVDLDRLPKIERERAE
ncbi:MAG: nucleotidyl transferase AbiEii/AbiGii toxin family protein [Pirellulales bacterium]|nr:nucleotidyl transferase AbiEii/AbiGii toxin family protein [Pirellulales bacterium]